MSNVMSSFKTKTRFTLTLAAFVLAATAAEAGDWTNSSMYNGYGAGTQNSASSYSMRDANGNLTMVNGQITSSMYQTGTGAQYSGGGVGMGGAGPTTGEAQAVGNQLSVMVLGSHNTTIIDSTQVNNGNQTATANVNRH
jgi:holdfast attachment protein HfaA